MALAVLSWIDILVLVVYFIGTLGVGVWATLSIAKWMQRNPDGGVEEYFLAAQGVTWLPIAGSIFATNVGATMFIGLSGTGAAEGFAPIMYEWGMVFILPLLAYVFLPVYRASASYTMPQYLAKRYGGNRIRICYTVVLLVSLVLLNVAGEMYAAALVVQLILGWNLYLSVVPILMIAMVYTVSGGLLAVIYTDAIQTIILLVGGVILSVISVNHVGGFSAIFEKFLSAGSNSSYYRMIQEGDTNISQCAFPPPDAFHIFRPVDSEYPWTGLTFGLAILGTFFFCNNQVIVQRSLAAKSIIHGKAGCVATMYLKILPFFLFLVPGMTGRILYRDEIACSSREECQAICQNPTGCTNIVYPLLLSRLMPTGLKGLQMAALLAANMSTLSSIFNSASTMFSIDLWKRVRPKASDRELVTVSKVCVVAMTVTGIGWLPVLQRVQGSQFWDYLMIVSSYLVPPLLAIFLAGILWPRATEKGAFFGMMSGFVVSVIRMAIHFSYAVPACGEPDYRPAVLVKVHYLHFSIITFTLTILITVIISLFTEPRETKKLHRVTLWTRDDQTLPDWTDDEDENEALASKTVEDTVPLLLSPEISDEEPTDEGLSSQREMAPPISADPSVEYRVTGKPTREGNIKEFLINALKLVFSFPEKTGRGISREERKRRLFESTSLQEPVLWSRVCACAALSLVIAMTAVIAYMA